MITKFVLMHYLIMLIIWLFDGLIIWFFDHLIIRLFDYLIWLFFDWGSRVESIRLTSRLKGGLFADNEILVKDRLFDIEFWHLIIMGSWWKTINYLYNWRILMKKITEINLINYINNFIFLHSKMLKLVYQDPKIN